MKLSEWRPTLYNYLNSILAPDGWMVDTPPDGAITYATLPPIRNIGFTFEPPYKVMANVTQELFYSERVSNELWHSIAIDRFEGIYGQLAYQVLTEANDIHPDILDLGIAEFGRVEEIPVTTEQLADGWLITLRWTLEATLKLDPEVIDPAVPITRVDIELWTNKLSDPTFTDRVLDTVLTTDED